MISPTTIHFQTIDEAQVWCDAIDMDAYRENALIGYRGGCLCHVRAPCNRHSDPLTVDEAEDLGWITVEKIQ